jgi:hypothetical protein
MLLSDGSITVNSPSPQPNEFQLSGLPGVVGDQERRHPLSWAPPVIRSGCSSPTSIE